MKEPSERSTEKSLSRYMLNREQHHREKIEAQKKLFEGKTEGLHFVTCAFCEFLGRDLSAHIRMHGMKAAEYRERWPMICEELRLEKRVNYSGEKNPGYRHGGKFSPWSKKFFKKDHDVEASKRKAAENAYRPSVEYHMKKYGLGETEARIQVSERQRTFSLKKCVERYGEKEGRERWEARQEKWQDTLRSKSDEEIRDITRRKMTAGPVSGIETQFGEEMRRTCPDLETQFVLLCPRKRARVFDFRLGNRLIEFHGDFWHARPTRFKKDEPTQWNKKLGRKLTAEEVWEKDREKEALAISQGFEILVVWEGDYRKEPTRVVRESVAFLTGSSESSSTLESFLT